MDLQSRSFMLMLKDQIIKNKNGRERLEVRLVDLKKKKVDHNYYCHGTRSET